MSASHSGHDPHGPSHSHSHDPHHNHNHDHLHAHGRGDSHHSHSARAVSSRVLWGAVLLTGGFAVVEAVGGWWSGSLALLADAGHMVTDAGALLLALVANVIARRPASDRHSYGLARFEIIAAFVNALAMLGVVIWLLIEAIQRIAQPVSVQGGTVLGVASIGLIVNVGVAWLLSRDHHNINTRAALLHVLGDLLGSVAAIAAGGVIYFGGPLITDPLLSMVVGGLILRSTLVVLRQTTKVLLDGVPDHVDYGRVGRALVAIDGIVSVHDLHVWSMVPGRCALSAHVLVADIELWPVILHRARHQLRTDFGIDHITLQPEWLRETGAAAPVIRLKKIT